MEFRKYQHLERFGTTEVNMIELGECYVFPKLDGTNASVWMSKGEVQAGSRKRHLTLDKDNAGFLEWVEQQANIKKYLKANPSHRLFGEWLVPHSLKTYKDSAWSRFYIFDVCIDSGEELEYLHYDDYKPLLEEFELDYIPYIAKIKNGSYEQFVNQMIHNVFMIEDGKGTGEGVVIKNYNFVNKYGRTTWAKIVTSEFKEKHAKTMGGHEVKGKKMIEEEIAKEFVTQALCEKVYSKIENESGFSSKNIPQLLNTIYYDLVREDCWEFVKKNKYPTINFSTLKHFTFIEVKNHMKNLF